MNRKELLTITALVLLALSPLTRADYKPGDRVTVLDAAGQRHVADIVNTATNGWYQVAIDGETRNDEGVFVFPSANIAKAAWYERIGAAFTERTQAVKTYGVTIAAALATWYASSVQVAGDKDTNQINASDAATIAKNSEVSALVNGPSTSARYAISGTFLAQTPSGTPPVTWYQSITFGQTRAGGFSGDIASVSGQPSGVGSESQVVLGGSWTLVDASEINIAGTLDSYTGRATLSLGGLVIKGIRYAPINGASIQLLEVQP